MFKNIIAITNRHLCTQPFLSQIEKIAVQKPERIILREKDLPGSEYDLLASQCAALCLKYHVPFSVSGRPLTALRLGCDLHLSFRDICQIPELSKKTATIGVSVHAVSEAAAAWKCGADYLIAGHIFATDCKPGLPPRGLQFLNDVCKAVPIPVYGIGGICPENLGDLLAQGASGGCMMSGLMKMC